MPHGRGAGPQGEHHVGIDRDPERERVGRLRAGQRRIGVGADDLRGQRARFGAVDLHQVGHHPFELVGIGGWRRSWHAAAIRRDQVVPEDGLRPGGADQQRHRRELAVARPGLQHDPVQNRQDRRAPDAAHHFGVARQGEFRPVQRLGRDAPQAVHGDVEPLRQGLGIGGGGRGFGEGRRSVQRAALDDRAMQQAGVTRILRDRGDGGSAGRLAEQRDAAGIAAEGRDVGLDPAQGRDLVLQSPIGEGAGLGVGEGRMGKPAQRAQPVVERDHHHVAARRERRPDRAGRIATPGAPGATMQPHHHGPPPLGVGRPDVQEQTVLGLRRRALVEPGRGPAQGLDRGRARLRRIPWFSPSGRWTRRGIAQRTDRRRGVGDAEEGRDVIRPRAPDGPGGGVHNRGVLRRGPGLR